MSSVLKNCSQQEGAGFFVVSEDSINYIGILGRLISVSYRMKVPPIRTFPVVVLPHKVGATFPGRSLSRRLWLSVKHALERVMHHEAGLEAFSGPFPHENPVFL